MKPEVKQIKKVKKDFIRRSEALLMNYDQGKLLFEKLFPPVLFGEVFHEKRIIFNQEPGKALEILFLYEEESRSWYCFFCKKTTPVDALMLLAMLLNCGMCQVVLFLEKYDLHFSLPDIAATDLNEIYYRQPPPEIINQLSEEDVRPLLAFYDSWFRFDEEINQQLLPDGKGKLTIPKISNVQDAVSMGKEEPTSGEVSGGQLQADTVSNEQLIARCSYQLRDEMELVRHHFEPSDRLQAKLFMTATDIYQYLANRYGEGWFQGDVARLGKLMNKEGYDKARSKRNGIYGYFLLLKEAEADAA